MTAYFVTATGTEIGKTFTTCALLHTARMNGRFVRGIKPIVSGWRNDSNADPSQIIHACGDKLEVGHLSPWRFAAPLSPHQAAQQQRETIVLTEVIQWCSTRVTPGVFTLIEGAGGVMTPLNSHETMLDLMVSLALPVILVTGSYLGTISHTLTALEVLRARKLNIAALVMCENEVSAITPQVAWEGLEPFLHDIPLRILQTRVSSWKEAQAIAALAEKL